MSVLSHAIELALKDKAPALHASLQASGELRKYATNLAAEISSQSVDLTMEQRRREGWDKLGPLECAAKMRTADHLNREALLAEALEFPPDETSPPSQG
jgi:hypothetical protein